MEYRYLGKSGLKVSEICLGTLSFGRQVDETLSHTLIDHYVESGDNFFDTANSYNAGASEEILGRWLTKHSRHKYIVATKVCFPTGAGPNDSGLSRRHIMRSVEDSLRRLQVEYIDLYQLHCWDAITPLAETLWTLNDLVRSGKVRYLGVSNFAAHQLQKAIDISSHRGWEKFVSLQPQYSLLERSIEWALLPLCRETGLGVLPWSPLRHGWLSGKYGRHIHSPPPDSRVQGSVNRGWTEAWKMREEEHTWEVVDALWGVAAETGRSPAQIALNWLLQQPGVTAPVIGVRNLQQLKENLGATGWSLNKKQIAHLSAVSARPLPYPYDFIARLGGR